MAVQVEAKAISASDIRGIIRRIFLFSVTVEIVVAAVLAVRFIATHGYGVGKGIYYGVFHSIAAFNSAGFSLFNDSFVSFAHDPLILLPLALAVVIGGTGFPVVFELVRSWRRPATWSLLTRVTVVVSGGLLLLATVAFFVVEIGNERTFGQVSPPQALIVAFFTAVMPRSGGLNAIDISALTPESNFLTDLLMFIGGGSAGTAGGIKVTTLGILTYVVIAELKGRSDVVIGRRRIATEVQRQALVIVVFSAAVVGAFTFLLMAMTPFGFERVLFEVISAFGTVGLSMGITPELSTSAKAIIVGLMFVGRIGPITIASALAARERTALTRVPEERMIIG
jgi:Trk-type K+ transport system membrane component